MEERIKEIMADSFEIDVSEINDESSLHSVEKWDSMGHMGLMLALEKEFDIKLDDDEIPTMTTLSLIVLTIESYKD